MTEQDESAPLLNADDEESTEQKSVNELKPIDALTVGTNATSPLLVSPRSDSYQAVNMNVGPHGKREVWLSAAITLKSVNMPEQQFTIVSVLNFFWKEDVIAEELDIEVKGWNIPDDTQGRRLPIDTMLPFDDYDEINLVRDTTFYYDRENGVVRMEIHCDATLTERLELERYPLDRQFMNVEVDVRTEYWTWLKRQPAWVPDKFSHMCTARLSEAVAEYKMSPPWITVQPHEEDGAGIRLRLRIERHQNFFICNIILPNFLLVLSCFSTFFIDPANPSGRLIVTVTLMLASVAFRFVVSDLLPRVSYLTLVDWYLAISFLLIAVVILDNGVCGYKTVKHGAQADSIVQGLLFSAWWVFHAFICVALTTDWFKQSWERMDLEDEMDEESKWLVADYSG